MLISSRLVSLRLFFEDVYTRSLHSVQAKVMTILFSVLAILLQNFGDGAGAYGAAAFADGEPKTLFHSNRVD